MKTKFLRGYPNVYNGYSIIKSYPNFTQYSDPVTRTNIPGYYQYEIGMIKNISKN
jgi:hypothetical protein